MNSSIRLQEKMSKPPQKLVDDLYEKGLKATNIIARDKEGGTSEKIVFPGSTDYLQ